ncbi:hypothetical protein GCM10007362_27980 [Saccharibacillus endophyticus]|uniref:Uncharacterized protein n=1 Tax=Saccharibacillus endophyticus TaxID=2060666 RepID=A0ABQ1ZV60_9BACL|nr:hypothetical protein GCM10007362_27980 [Saccharibacillus endophyticus]
MAEIDAAFAVHVSVAAFGRKKRLFAKKPAEGTSGSVDERATFGESQTALTHRPSEEGFSSLPSADEVNGYSGIHFR